MEGTGELIRERSERDWESAGGGLGRRSRDGIWRRATTHLLLDLPCAGAAHRRTSPPWPAWLPALIRRTKLSQYPIGVGASGERGGDWPRVRSGEEWEWGLGENSGSEDWVGGGPLHPQPRTTRPKPTLGD
jgi:hypothetical protein